MVNVDWSKLAQSVIVLPGTPQWVKLPPEAGAAVWWQDDKLLVPDEQGSFIEVIPIEINEANDKIAQLISQGSTVLLFKDGKLCGLLDAKIAIAGLAEQKERYKAFFTTLLEVGDEAITVIGTDHKVLGFNYKAQQLYKIKREDILGKDIKDFFNSLELVSQLSQVLSNNEKVRDKYHQPMQGTHVMINASPVNSGEQLLGAISSEREVTQAMFLYEELARSHSQVQELKSEINKPARTQDTLTEEGLPKLTEKMERQMIEQVLAQTQGDRTKAAAILGIPRATLYYKIKKHGIGKRYDTGGEKREDRR